MTKASSPTGPESFRIYTARRNLDAAVATIAHLPIGQVKAQTRWEDGKAVLGGILIVPRERWHERGAVPDLPVTEEVVRWIGKQPAVRHWLARLTYLLSAPRRRSSFSELVG